MDEYFSVFLSINVIIILINHLYSLSLVSLSYNAVICWAIISSNIQVSGYKIEIHVIQICYVLQITIAVFGNFAPLFYNTLLQNKPTSYQTLHMLQLVFILQQTHVVKLGSNHDIAHFCININIRRKAHLGLQFMFNVDKNWNAPGRTNNIRNGHIAQPYIIHYASIIWGIERPFYHVNNISL